MSLKDDRQNMSKNFILKSLRVNLHTKAARRKLLREKSSIAHKKQKVDRNSAFRELATVKVVARNRFSVA